MKQWICHQPGMLRLGEIDIPGPGKGEVLIKINRIGICGTDLHAYRGKQPFFSYPRVLGHELSGIIADIGPEVSGFGQGDAVTVIPYMSCGHCHACRSGKTNCCMKISVLGVHQDGGMQEYLIVPEAFVLKTKGLSPDQAAMVECLSIGTHAVLKRARVEAGESVLVLGAGPIGLGVMKTAKLCGAHVTAVDMDKGRLNVCETWAGADLTLPVSDRLLEEMKSAMDGELPQVVFDATGNPASMHRSFDYVSHGGRLVFVGLFTGKVSFEDSEFHKKEMTLMASRNAVRDDFLYVMDALKEKNISDEGFVTHHVPFDQVGKQFDRLIAPGNGVIKATVVLEG